MFLRLSLLLFIPLSFLFSQDSVSPPAKSSDADRIILSVEYFNPLDLSKEMYSVSLKTPRTNELIEDLKGTSKKKYKFTVGGIQSDIVPSSVKKDKDDDSLVNLNITAYNVIPSGESVLKITVAGNEIISHTVQIPSRNSTPGKQPLIHSITPEAGRKGDTITVKGENFGDDIDLISVVFGEYAKTDQGQTVEDFMERKPFYLANDGNKQELKFVLPVKKDLLKDALYKRILSLHINVNGRPSDLKKLVILHDNWKFYVAGLTVFLSILFYFILAIAFRNVRFAGSVLIDRATNTYSLSKFQAMIWTITLLGSYFYIAVSHGLLLGNGVIPDFNASLIGLLSISYGGMISANGLGTARPKNELIRVPPRFSNLFSSGSEVDIARLQLFGFTIVAVLIYIYNLIISNPLNGMPDIPTTLLGLLGASHSGYLGGKLMGNKTVISMIKPHHVPGHKYGFYLHILGAGFTERTKVIIGSNSEPLEAEFISPSALGVRVPSFSSFGKQKITLIPPGGSAVTADDCFEVITVDPYEITHGEEREIVIKGSDFVPKMTVEVYGQSLDPVEATSVEYVDSETIKCTLPANLGTGEKWLTIKFPDKREDIDVEACLIVLAPLDSSTDEEEEDSSEESVTEKKTVSKSSAKKKGKPSEEGDFMEFEINSES
ncbi:MAG TPA: IPT/TIG domain-containing protein [Leptospiraceae bacterium]|nr:IPT/TIG domain-containing protein [Leptospiraceae bacterium]HMY67616.1 IPT/TIG domain-containing protein [Leptospiraceae bacterium]HNI96525.1 IPT/TIG domain-containing protein [Leptospiraceae bacterium]HNM01844.1 IPT/TIG domain-containing protein [Leptospiraceae bacterium]HNN04299.1 IPT/TIG domain-containing protein [Leptospiraceae bacterium]